jgi:hypothetical protein
VIASPPGDVASSAHIAFPAAVSRTPHLRVTALIRTKPKPVSSRPSGRRTSAQRGSASSTSIRRVDCAASSRSIIVRFPSGGGSPRWSPVLTPAGPLSPVGARCPMRALPRGWLAGPAPPLLRLLAVTAVASTSLAGQQPVTHFPYPRSSQPPQLGPRHVSLPEARSWHGCGDPGALMTDAISVLSVIRAAHAQCCPPVGDRLM